MEIIVEQFFVAFLEVCVALVIGKISYCILFDKFL
jgi:hypothetical protein